MVLMIVALLFILATGEAALCPPPEENDFISPSTFRVQVGESVTYRCKMAGYRIAGQPDNSLVTATIECLAGSPPTYSSLPPTCERSQAIEEENSTGQLNGECPGMTSSLGGFVHHPGYPNDYTSNLLCSNVLQAPAGHWISLTLHFADLQCGFDKLEIFLDSDRLEEYCSISNPVTIQYGQLVFIRFTSDSSIQKSGFFITWTAEPIVCGEVLTASTGEISSPNFPETYPNFASCEWEIRALPGFQIKLTIHFMDIEEVEFCNNDYLQISEGVTPNFFKCGQDNDITYITKGSVLWLRLSTNSIIGGKGFNASYETFYENLCTNDSFELSEPSGEIYSPGYPNPYFTNRDCTWSITSPPGTQIKITFTFFDLESSTSCQNDYVKIHDGTSNNHLIGVYCGAESPAVMELTGNVATVIFHSNANIVGGGFALSWTSDTIVCGGLLTSQSGMITSPGHPISYPNGVECVWGVIVSEGFQIQLMFESFDIHSSDGDCLDDYVQVAQNVSQNYGQRLCGNSSFPAILSQENIMYIKFVTNETGVGGGFSATYESVHKCPEGWWRSKLGYCYYSLPGDDSKWEEARGKCEALSGQLAILDTEEKLNDVTEIGSNLGTGPHWIGGGQITDPKGEFIWIDNSPVNPDLIFAGKKELKSKKNEMIRIEFNSAFSKFSLKSKKSTSKATYICQI